MYVKQSWKTKLVFCMLGSIAKHSASGIIIVDAYATGSFLENFHISFNAVSKISMTEQESLSFLSQHSSGVSCWGASNTPKLKNLPN